MSQTVKPPPPVDAPGRRSARSHPRPRQDYGPRISYLIPDPVYPEDANATKLASGNNVVVLHVLISKQGRITNAKVVSGPPILATSAIKAVKIWRYKPSIKSTASLSRSTQP